MCLTCAEVRKSKFRSFPTMTYFPSGCVAQLLHARNWAHMINSLPCYPSFCIISGSFRYHHCPWKHDRKPLENCWLFVEISLILFLFFALLLTMCSPCAHHTTACLDTNILPTNTQHNHLQNCWFVVMMCLFLFSLFALFPTSHLGSMIWASFKHQHAPWKLSTKLLTNPFTHCGNMSVSILSFGSFAHQQCRYPQWYIFLVFKNI